VDIRPYIELRATIDASDVRSPFGRWHVGDKAIVKPGPWHHIPDVERGLRILRSSGDFDSPHTTLYFQEDQWQSASSSGALRGSVLLTSSVAPVRMPAVGTLVLMASSIWRLGRTCSGGLLAAGTSLSARSMRSWRMLGLAWRMLRLISKAPRFVWSR